MPVYKLRVVKQPPKDPFVDRKPNFGHLDVRGLHLELIENKKKLKPGLPLIPINRTALKPRPISSPPSSPHYKEHKNTDARASPARSGEFEMPMEDNEEDVEAFIKELGDEDMSPIISPRATSPEKSTRYRERSPSYKEPSYEGSDMYDENEQRHEERTPEEQENDDKQEYLIRFKILKKQYKNYEFPEYTEHTDLHSLKRMYKDTLRLINIDENVGTYKNFLAGGFFGIEVLATKIGLDFKGFSSYQMKKMDKYERLLVELGEKSYTSFADNWPVEVRLIGIILLDAAIFYIGKLVTENAGDGMSDIIGMMFGMPSKISKPKMRGPSVSAEDITNRFKHND